MARPRSRSTRHLPQGLFAKAGMRSFLPPKQLSRLSLPTEVFLRLQDLYEEMQRFGPAEADAAALHFMAGVCRLLRASNAFWVGAVRLQSGAAGERDPQHGWRGLSLLSLHTSAKRRAITRRAIREQDGGPPAQTTQAITAGAGRWRVRRLRELVSFPAFRRTAHFRTACAPLGLVDRLFAVTPVNADVESYFCFDLEQHTSRRFSVQDSLIAGLATRALRRLHRDLLLSRGLGVGQAPLTPAERKVLRLLLGGLPEKGIGARLSLTRSSVHQYVCSVYKKLGVKSRHALTALWLEH